MQTQPKLRKEQNMMTRRQALKTTTLATAACAAVSSARLSLAQPPPPPARPGFPPPGERERERERERRVVPGSGTEIEPFKLAPLPYPVDALEPYIDAQTMEIHHNKHHAAYVTNLTKALADHPALGRKPMFELLKELNSLPESVRT